MSLFCSFIGQQYCMLCTKNKQLMHLHGGRSAKQDGYFQVRGNNVSLYAWRFSHTVFPLKPKWNPWQDIHILNRGLSHWPLGDEVMCGHFPFSQINIKLNQLQKMSGSDGNGRTFGGWFASLVFLLLVWNWMSISHWSSSLNKLRWITQNTLAPLKRKKIISDSKRQLQSTLQRGWFLKAYIFVY